MDDSTLALMSTNPYKVPNTSSKEIANRLDKQSSSHFGHVRPGKVNAQLPRTEQSFHLILGDCLSELDAIATGSVQLAYVDPPFFTNKLFQRERGELDDRWGRDLQKYLDWVYPRLNKLPRTLNRTGVVFVHCDYHASHYLKVLLDRIFGQSNFVNEIIWKRQSAHNDGKQGALHFGRIHDTILVYAKSKHYKWNSTFEPYSPDYINETYRYTEQTTYRRYALGDLTGPGGASRDNPTFTLLGVTRAWRFSRSKMIGLLEEGKIVQTRPGGSPRLKRYLDEMKGRPIQDIWDDIPPIKGGSKESAHYPTQKPIKLLERIIKTATDEDDTILDPFCGSGTSLVSAWTLGRRGIGVDSSRLAIEVARKRLVSLGAEPLVSVS
jgi:DNA modification methylase